LYFFYSTAIFGKYKYGGEEKRRNLHRSFERKKELNFNCAGKEEKEEVKP
jgi:hypothetical protein